jgi:hypothetical protein
MAWAHVAHLEAEHGRFTGEARAQHETARQAQAERDANLRRDDADLSEAASRHVAECRALAAEADRITERAADRLRLATSLAKANAYHGVAFLAAFFAVAVLGVGVITIAGMATSSITNLF